MILKMHFYNIDNQILDQSHFFCGKIWDIHREAEVKVGRSVSFDLGSGGEEDHEALDEALEDPWKDLHHEGQAAVRQSQGSTIIVEQPSVEAPLEDFDIPFKEDALNGSC